MMAHNCPDCGNYCKCKGDCDDDEMGIWEDCIHCLINESVCIYSSSYHRAKDLVEPPWLKDRDNPGPGPESS